MISAGRSLSAATIRSRRNIHRQNRAADKYPWVIELLGRRPAKVVAVALANKMARIAWAVLAKGESYRAPTRSNNATIAGAA
jgi:transposase